MSYIGYKNLCVCIILVGCIFSVRSELKPLSFHPFLKASVESQKNCFIYKYTVNPSKHCYVIKYLFSCRSLHKEQKFPDV